MLSFHFMAIHFLLIFCLVNVAIAGGHGRLSEEDHWISVFPNTPMPKALKDLLPPPPPAPGSVKPSIDWTKRNSKVALGAPRFRDYEYQQSSTEINISGDEVISSKEFTGGSSKKYKSTTDAPINPFIIYENIDSNKKSKGVKTSRGMDAPINPFIIYRKKTKDLNVNPFVIYGEKSKGVNVNPFVIYEKKSKGVNVNPFVIYGKESKGANVPINPRKEFKGNKNPLGRKHGNVAMNETMYFFQEDLRPGKMVKLPLLTKSKDLTTFLPRQVAQSIPFSTDKLPQILKHFSFDSESMEANAMELTIKGCEREVMRGEEMFCATSFESFVDSSVSKLGKNIKLLANELGKETDNPVFMIGRGIQNMGEHELVCHKMMYPYAVFLCHSISGTMVYKVPLVGIDGTKAKALAICHKDTSAWSPDHPAFQSLKVKPGTVPICHFVVRDTLAWVRK